MRGAAVLAFRCRLPAVASNSGTRLSRCESSMPPRTHLTPRYPCRTRTRTHTASAHRTGHHCSGAGGRRACVQAFGMGLGNSVAGEWRAYRLTTRDRFANLVRSGGAEIRAQMGGPADVSVRVLDLNDGMYELHWCAPAPDAQCFLPPAATAAASRSGCAKVPPSPSPVQPRPFGHTAAATKARACANDRRAGGNGHTQSPQECGDSVWPQEMARLARHGPMTCRCAIVAGEYNLDTFLGAARVPRFPLHLRVAPAVCDPMSCDLSGEGLISHTAGSRSTVVLRTRDRFQNATHAPADVIQVRLCIRARPQRPSRRVAPCCAPFIAAAARRRCGCARARPGSCSCVCCCASAFCAFRFSSPARPTRSLCHKPETGQARALACTCAAAA